MYRPEGWEKTLREILDRFGVTYMNREECQLILALADAMLERLFNMAKDSPTGIFVIDSNGVNVFRGAIDVLRIRGQ